jgi:PAS domain S-box-containing protein
MAWEKAYEELRAIQPSLPSLESIPQGDDGWRYLFQSLMTALEQSHRSLIQRDTQLAGLRDLTDRLLSAPDASGVARLLVQYLRKGYGFQVVVLVLDEADAGVRAYWSGQDGSTPTQGELLWKRDEVSGTELGQLLWGDPQGAPESGAVTKIQHTGSPRPGSFHRTQYDIIIPLPSRRMSGSVNIGVLAVRLDSAKESDGATQLELEGIAHSLASCVENQNLQREIRNAQRLREDLLRSLGHALIAVDSKERILAFNETAAGWTGIQPADVLDRPIDALPQSLAPLSVRLRGALEHKIDLPAREGEIITSSGKGRPVSITANLLRDDSGEPYGAVAVAADLSVIKAMEQRIRHLDRLAAVGQFTGAIAHEIRNPLAGIAAGVEFLRGSFEEDASEQKDIQFLVDETHRLNRIIQDLFELANPRQSVLESVRLRGVIEKSIQSVSHEFKGRSISLNTDLCQAECTVSADADRLRQVFINLLKNAAEASSAGTAVQVIARTDNGNEVEVMVQDEGEGLTEEQQKHLFEPFFTTKKQGMGLGLYISHSIVQQHGGRMEVDSQPGAGSQFRVVLPMMGQKQEQGSAS